jgi:3-oxoacyl-[acyl-carrier protein] reductase
MNRKVALVTGASRGIGRGITEALASQGWTIAINYRSDHQSAEATLAVVKNRGGDGFIIRADVSDLRQHETLLQSILQNAGQLDLLVNNAGIAPRVRTDMLQATVESYDEVMGTNLRGPFFLTQRTALLMIDLVSKEIINEPKIINITSMSSVTASPNRAEYCISKAGLSMMSSLWAARLAEFGITVFEIRPGVIETDMTAGVHQNYDALIAQGVFPIARWGMPGDVGKAVMAIANGLFPYSTGQVFNVDGGFHITRL